MSKESLKAEDKVRLSTLVQAYLDPPAPTFSINGKGEVTLIKAKLMDRILGKESGVTLDFMEVTQVIVGKLMDTKAEIPYVAQLCGEGFGTLLESNDRSSVIKKLYMAHLVEEQPKNTNESRRHKGVEIQVEQRERVIPARTRGDIITFSKVPSNYQLALDVERLLNQSQVIILGDQ